MFGGELLGVKASDLPKTLLLNDNVGALKLGREGMISNKLKHMDLAITKIIEWAPVHFRLKEVTSFDNLADYWTKPMGPSDSARHRGKFMRRVEVKHRHRPY